MPQTTEFMLSREMRQCIDECLRCYAVCVETKAHCISMGGKHAEASHIGALADCAKLCETSANLMLHNSELHGRVCGICADACERCAESCEQVDRNDEVMRRCVEECRRCAESCRRMAA